jgi:hypothetical protein
MYCERRRKADLRTSTSSHQDGDGGRFRSSDLANVIDLVMLKDLQDFLGLLAAGPQSQNDMVEFPNRPPGSHLVEAEIIRMAGNRSRTKKYVSSRLTFR